MQMSHIPCRLWFVCTFFCFVVSIAYAQNREEISIEGTVLMLDNTTPHVAVVVQAVIPAPLALDGRGAGGEGEPTVVATTLSDETGKYRFINLKPGRYQARCYTLNGYIYYQEGKVLQVQRGKPLKNIDFRFAPFKKGTWKNYDFLDGLAHHWIWSIYQDPSGMMWFGAGGGLYRYDGKEFVNFTLPGELARTTVLAIHRDPSGVMWFGTSSGVFVYDGKRFTSLTQKDSWVKNEVHAIQSAPDGVLWFGTSGGVFRYDVGRNSISTYTTKDGLASNSVWAIHRDPSGVMWFGTEGGVSVYDGKRFINLTTKDGLASNSVRAIQSAPGGVMWFGTEGGVSRYDGKRFVNFTTKDGLATNRVNAIYREPSGVMWFGGWGGVSRYDGKQFVNFTTKDGLAFDVVYAIHRTPDGVMWFGTFGGGVSRYDGTTWTSLDTRDGLVNNMVVPMEQDSDGSLLFGTDGGLTRFRPSTAQPTARIVSVRTDKLYTEFGVSHGVSVPSQGKGVASAASRRSSDGGTATTRSVPNNELTLTAGTRVTISYSSIDFKTVPEKRQYRLRIKEINQDWRSPTKATAFDDTFKKAGTYTFEVQAIDRDGNYSKPASLTLHVKRPWWVYALLGTIGVSIPLIAVGFYFGKRLQTQRAIAQQFNPYIAGRVVGTDLFYGRSDILTDIERTLANNCFLIYGERRIGKSSIQHQLKERLAKADDPTYKFIPAYIDLQGVAEEDFFRTIAAGVVEHAAGLFKEDREALGLRLDEGNLTDRPYSYRDLNRDLRTIIDHLKEGETKAIKIVLLMDEVDTLNTYSLRTNLNLRGLFMGPLKENLVLVMSGLYLKMDWSAEGGGSPPFNFLSREIQIQPLDEDSARKLITEPVKGFYTYEPKGIDLILSLSELRPFTIQGFCLRAVNRILADSRTKITVADIEAIQDSVLAEVASIRGERAGTALPASFNEALAVIADLKAENAWLRGEAA